VTLFIFYKYQMLSDYCYNACRDRDYESCASINVVLGALLHKIANAISNNRFGLR
jgi:hypothetical protein